MQHSNAANRLNRLPISSFHKFILYSVSFAYFFEFANTNTFAVASPQLLKAWHISIKTIAYISSISFLGMFIGSILGGRLADKIGRKKSMVITVALFSVFSLLNTMSWNTISLGTFQFLTGMGLAAMTIVANTYISEMFPASSRGKYQSLAIVIGILGTPATTWVARFIIPMAPWAWRLVFLWGGIGLVFLIFLARMEESPRWYESRGQFDKADEILRRIEAKVGAEKGSLPEPIAEPARKVEGKKVSVSELFSGRYLRRTLVLTVLWVCQTIGFFGYSSWAPTLLAKHGMTVAKSLTYVALSTLGAPLGSYIASLVADKFDRKWLLTMTGVMIAVSGFLYGTTFQPVFIVIFGLMVNMFERTYTSLAYAYSPELFPTEARATGTSVPYGIGRLSNLIGPIIISSLFLAHGYQSVFMFVAGTWLVGAIVLGLFGPSTKGQNMDEVGETEVSIA